jgi:hypothetical protein
MKNDEGTTFKKDESTNLKGDEKSAAINAGESKRAMYAASTARKEGVQKGAWISGAIGLVIIVLITVFGYTTYNNAQHRQLAVIENQKKAFTELLTSRDSVINEWMITFDQIEKDLNMIKEKENIISIQSANTEFSKDKKQAILNDIEYINSMLDQNKKKITSLTAQLKNSGGEIKGLQVKIASLEATMKLRETEVSDLKVALVGKDFEIGQLNTRMNDQQVAIAQKDEKISNQTNEMNKAYVAYGTYKDLKAKGLVTKNGGFLGIGKKENMITNFKDSSFTIVNINEMKEIPVNSRIAKLITDHPKGSYEMIADGKNKISRIEIKDPEQFWKISKYAIVETKN